MMHIQPYCALQWCTVPDLGPWSGAAWEFVKKQKQRKQPGNAMAFELISAAAWRVLHRFLACSLQTAQTVMKSSLTRTRARNVCQHAPNIFINPICFIHLSFSPPLPLSSHLQKQHSRTPQLLTLIWEDMPFKRGWVSEQIQSNYMRMRPFLPSYVSLFLSLPHTMLAPVH